MTGYRDALPQLGPETFLTDSGIETDLIFNKGVDLPEFAGVPAPRRRPRALELLRAYYRSHAAVAVDAGVGFVLESATWRANADWGARLGYDATELDRGQPAGCRPPRRDPRRDRRQVAPDRSRSAAASDLAVTPTDRSRS